MVAWGVAAILLVLAAVRMVGPGAGQPSVGVRVDGGVAGGPAGGGPGGPVSGRGKSGRAAAGGLYVHVAGEVRRPGLYRVPEGSRAAAAIHLAGGPTGQGELAAVNLAQPLEDGQQVIVPRRGPPGTAGAVSVPGMASGAPGVAGAVPVSLTTATVEQLEQLDGIGPTLAQRIIEFRD